MSLLQVVASMCFAHLVEPPQPTTLESRHDTALPWRRPPPWMPLRFAGLRGARSTACEARVSRCTKRALVGARSAQMTRGARFTAREARVKPREARRTAREACVNDARSAFCRARRWFSSWLRAFTRIHNV